ncbi:MAG: tryptophan-rich sensory protein [Pseudolabrys sp.]|nr:tryptophan-rich sensory protein [Pseudolabrys sp.]MBV9956031.1 tryptophan-rich sensory protein [Pseudolabrys sp.]
MPANKYISLAAFIVVVLACGMAIGYLTTPDAWYASLNKPAFNPPNWVFAPVWTTLYVLIAIAGWRTFRREPRSLAMNLWLAQMALNFSWSPVFFGAHWIGAALMIIAVLLATILAFIATAWQSDRASALLFVPYAAWVAFATLLNASLWLLN